MEQIILIALGAAIGKITEQAIEWYRNRHLKTVTPTLINADDISNWGWSGEYLLRKIIELDKQLLGKALTTEAREGTTQQWAPVYMAHPEGWEILITGKKRITGHWCFFALNEDTYQKAISGHLLDSEITLDKTVKFDVPGHYNIYFCMLGALQNLLPRAGTHLLNSFFDRVQKLAERGIFLREICANAYTDDGKRVCEGFGMERVCEHIDHGTIYSLRLKPWPKKLSYKRWAELSKIYDKEI